MYLRIEMVSSRTHLVSFEKLMHAMLAAQSCSNGTYFASVSFLFFFGQYRQGMDAVIENEKKIARALINKGQKEVRLLTSIYNLLYLCLQCF